MNALFILTALVAIATTPPSDFDRSDEAATPPEVPTGDTSVSPRGGRVSTLASGLEGSERTPLTRKEISIALKEGEPEQARLLGRALAWTLRFGDHDPPISEDHPDFSLMAPGSWRRIAVGVLSPRIGAYMQEPPIEFELILEKDAWDPQKLSKILGSPAFTTSVRSVWKVLIRIPEWSFGEPFWIERVFDDDKLRVSYRFSSAGPIEESETELLPV